MLLNAGRKAYNEANPQFASERFTELLAKFGGYKDANAARYGLGLALLDLPDRNFQKALESFGPSAAGREVLRTAASAALLPRCVPAPGWGRRNSRKASRARTRCRSRTQNANGHFTEALKHFTAARDAFEKKAPPDADWAARARCDIAEMELRLGKMKEARATAEPFVKDASAAKSKFRPLGLYYHGTACFMLNEIPGAAKSLGQLAPFDQVFGPHARLPAGARPHRAG